MRVRARGWCVKHWTRWRRHGDPLYEGRIVGDDARRFWAKVEKGRRCWLWRGHVDEKGYGRFDWNDQHGYAHRFSWEVANGEALPPLTAGGMEIDHLCHNRQCVRPGHLQLVPRRENVRRAFSAAGIHHRTTHCPQGHPYDEANTWLDQRGRTPRRRCRQCSHNRYAHPGQDCYSRRCEQWRGKRALKRANFR